MISKNTPIPLISSDAGPKRAIFCYTSYRLISRHGVYIYKLHNSPIKGPTFSLEVVLFITLVYTYVYI